MSLKRFMQGKVAMFIFDIALYCIIFLTWNKFEITSKQIVEMVFMGSMMSLLIMLTRNPFKRLVQDVLTRAGLTSTKTLQSKEG